MKSEKSQLRAGVILSYVNMLLGNLIPIFYTPIMLSLLGQNEYGLYKLSGSVTSYLGLISLGIGSAVNRYLIKARMEGGQEEEEAVFGLFMVIFQIIAIASLMIGSILTLNLDIWYGAALSAAEMSRMKIIVFILVCNTALSFSQSPYLSIVSAHEQFIFLQCMNIISTCVAPMLNLAVLLLGYASIGMAVSSMILGIVTRMMYIGYVRRKMGIRARYRNLPTNLLREILGFSFWVFVANVVGQLYNATDTVMIGAIPALATVGVAVYNVGGVFYNIAFGLTTGISSLISPKVNRMVFQGADGDELTGLAVKVGRLQGYIISLIVAGFIAFGRPFIRLYAGVGYEQAYWVAVWMLIPNIIPLVQSVCLSVIVAQNKHKFRSLVYLGIAVLNVVGTWFLVQTELGIVGAAFMTGFAVVIGQGLVMNWYYHKKTNMNMIAFWKQLVPLYIIPAVLCAFTLFLTRWIDLNPPLTLCAGIVIFTLLDLGLNWALIMNEYERNIFVEPLKKLGGRIRRH